LRSGIGAFAARWIDVRSILPDQNIAHYRCGQKANDLDAFIARRPVGCVEVDRDQYKRAVAVCTVAGIELADWMVWNGHALDWPKYSQGDYAAAQDEARRAEPGMCIGRFVESWRYRACRRTAGSSVSCSDPVSAFHGSTIRDRGGPARGE
jgi:endonuclease YncB( thermonuclease family)